jgi:folate-binding protein YgfZ
MANAPTTAASISTVLRLEGADALALLDRIATRQLLDLEPGHARWAPFCDFRGRLLHRALVVVTSDRAVWMLRDDAPGTSLAGMVNAHVFREDVRIGLGESRWSARLQIRNGIRASDGIEERDQIPWVVPAANDLAMALVAPDAAPAGPDVERARMRAGRPRHGHEIAQDFNPFEVNLAHEVHLAKGCYTGQEALQRLITYDSVRRRLARVEGSGTTPIVPQPIAGSAGVLTSAIGEETGGHWSGLAVLRHDAVRGEAPLMLESGGAIDRIEAFDLGRPEGREGAR